MNIIINAADAMGSNVNTPDGHLKILTRMDAADGETMEIMFADNGPGIPETVIGNIFDPFFTTKDPGKGTGLGLSVSFMIVESFGGTVRAENAAEGGAVMTILLPLAT